MERRARILLVDDDELTLDMLKATLEQEHEILCADNGEQALALVTSEIIDLVVLDVEMPGLDGYEVCRRIKLAAKLPVIFHSGHTSIDERLRGYRVGGDDYLVKPFIPAELTAKVFGLVRQYAHERELNEQLAEAINAAHSTADMVGEAGVVLEFQKQVNFCESHEALARALMNALVQWGWKGCVRVRGRQQVADLNGQGRCTALEATLLDHLETLNQGIHSVGKHTGFMYGNVMVFVRDLSMLRPEGSMDRAESDRMGRAIDNIALLIQSALALVTALDAGATAKDLDHVRNLVAMTHEALADIRARSDAQRVEVERLVQRLREQMEAHFVHLGLTEAQEDQISSVVREHGEDVLKSLDQGRELQDFLQRIVLKLGQNV